MKRKVAIVICFSLIMSLLCGISADAKQKKDKKKKKIIKVEAEFTGYYPDDSTMEGGYRAANMEWLEPSDWTCAAPKCVPFGSKITVGGTGNWRDGHTYRVNDRGGAIIIDNEGVYHIDILMAGPEQANKFGRVRGYIEIECPSK